MGGARWLGGRVVPGEETAEGRRKGGAGLLPGAKRAAKLPGCVVEGGSVVT